MRPWRVHGTPADVSTDLTGRRSWCFPGRVDDYRADSECRRWRWLRRRGSLVGTGRVGALEIQPTRPSGMAMSNRVESTRAITWGDDETFKCPVKSGRVAVGKQLRDDRVNLVKSFPLESPLCRTPWTAWILSDASANFFEQLFKPLAQPLSFILHSSLSFTLSSFSASFVCAVAEPLPPGSGPFRLRCSLYFWFFFV